MTAILQQIEQDAEQQRAAAAQRYVEIVQRADAPQPRTQRGDICGSGDACVS